MFKWLETRLLWGLLLVVGGIVFLLQNLGLVDVSGLFWALVFGLIGAFFLVTFFQDRANWWALIPGFTLLSIATTIALERFAPRISEVIGGTIVLGGIGLSFVIIYLLDRRNWWAIIPGGVMVTLALVAGLDEFGNGFDTGGIFLLGLAFTFALVAMIPTEHGRMRWAWIPAGVLAFISLLAMGFAERMNLVGPLALILVGAFLIFRNFLSRRNA